jgi:hypothetical protein
MFGITNNINTTEISPPSSSKAGSVEVLFQLSSCATKYKDETGLKILTLASGGGYFIQI